MAIQSYREKAYDKIEWKSFPTRFRELGFCEWTNWIKSLEFLKFFQAVERYKARKLYIAIYI